jgi:hypothetical protein
MKKTTWLGAAALATTLLAGHNAQAQGLRFGIKAGANLANLSGDLANQDQYKNRWGFHAGALLNIGILPDNFLSIQPEVLYSQKGYKYGGGQTTILGQTYVNTGSVRYDYIDVPVMVRLRFSGVFVEAGPQYSYLLHVSTDRSTTLNGTVLTGAQDQTTNLDNVKRSEIGYAAGLGFQADSGFLLGLRYNGSFTDFAKDGYNNNELRNARNSVFQAYVGYMLGGSTK